MSGMILPLPEPPAANVDEVLELLQAARGYYRDAEQQAELLLESFGEAAAGASVAPAQAMYYRTELTVAQHRLKAWESTISVLEYRARVMGLHP